DKRKAVGENARAESAEQNVFHGSFIRTLLPAQESSENIKTECHGLEAQEHHNEISAGSHEHHADAGEQQQRVVLAFLFLFDFEVLHGEQNDQRGGGKKERREKQEKGIDDDGAIKPEELALSSDRKPELPHGVSAENCAGKGQHGVEIPVFCADSEIHQQNPQTKESQLDLRKNDRSISLQVTNQRAENWDMHAAVLLRLRHSGGKIRDRQFCLFRRIKLRVHLANYGLHRLFDE